MILQSCLLIKTTKFPLLKGEKEQLVNDGMVGKVLCAYLQEGLPSAGMQVPFFCNEDWGWWLQTERSGFSLGVWVYPDPDADTDLYCYALLPSLQAPWQWAWSRFRRIDRSEDVMAVIAALEQIFTRDPDIHAVSDHHAHPF